MSLSDALNTRDALAKALYSQLFTWLVHKINRIINPTVQQHQSVAVLDIFGFEVCKLLPENDMDMMCEKRSTNDTVLYCILSFLSH